MEEELESQKPVEVNLVVSEEMRSYFYEITKWARFIAFFGICVAILFIMASIFIPQMLGQNPALAAKLGVSGGTSLTLITVVYIVLALLFLYPSLLLRKISAKGREGILFGDQESFNMAIANLKTLFKFWGILVILAILGYFLAFISNVALPKA